MSGEVLDRDQNREILACILQRLQVGIKSYGHGFRVHDDTRQFGTENDDWVEMALEEAIDGSLYLVAQLLRIRDSQRSAEGRGNNRTPPASGERSDDFTPTAPTDRGWKGNPRG